MASISVFPMNSERNRIATFKGLSSNMYKDVRCLLLAKAGFYCRDNSVRTFCCGIEADPRDIKDTPVEFHSQRSAHCMFFNESDGSNSPTSKNIPFLLKSAVKGACHWEDKGDFKARVAHSQIDGVVSSQWCDPAKTPISSDPTKLNEDRSAIETARTLQTPEFLHNMKIEAKRTETYFDFPATAPVSPKDLAQAGFFYLGKLDRVQCAFCRGVLRDWESDDSPISEHKRHFPHCSFTPGDLVDSSPKGDTTTPAHSEKGDHGVTAGKQYSASRANTPPPASKTPKSKKSGTRKPRNKTRAGGNNAAHATSAQESFIQAELSKENASLRETSQCTVCMDEDRNTVFLPCGHLVSCSSCAPRLRNCPICRTYIKGTVLAFLS